MGRNQKLGATKGQSRPRKLYDDSDDEKLDLKIDSITQKIHTPAFMYVLTFFASLGGFLFGYDTGVISGAMIKLRNEFGLTYFWQELVVSVTLGTAAVFALVGGCLNDRLGRRAVILASCVIFTVGAICMGVAVDKYMLLAGRVVVGAAIGMSSTTVPIYVAECAPPHIRGRLVSANIAMVAGGQFIASVVDGAFGSDPINGWRYMLGLAGIPSFILFIGFIFMPESPRWLISSQQEEKARRVLQTMRGQLDIEEEYESIKANCLETQQNEDLSSNIPVCCQVLHVSSVRKALFVGCSLQMVQQLAGINTVMYYSATIIRMSGVKSDEAAIWLAAVTASVNFMFTLLGLYLVEKIGRRPLTLGSLLGAVLSLVLLAVGFHMASLNTPQTTIMEKIVTNATCHTHSTCDECMMDLTCGFCYSEKDAVGVTNSSCLPTDIDNPWISSVGRCKTYNKGQQLSWAYDYCPSPYSWMPLVGLILYLVSFAPGMGPMPWTVNAEIYPLWARGTASSISTCINWLFNFIVSVTFLTLTQSLTRMGTFLLYAGVTTSGAFWIFLWLPETKGKTLEEMENLFEHPWCGANTALEYNTKTIQAGTHKMLARIANREDPDWTASSNSSLDAILGICKIVTIITA